MRHPTLGEITFEHTASTVESAPDLRMVAYTPASEPDAALLRQLIGVRTR